MTAFVIIIAAIVVLSVLIAASGAWFCLFCQQFNGEERSHCWLCHSKRRL